MWRIYFVTFWGKARSEQAGHAHEASIVMLVPLVVLATLSVLSGFVPFADYVHLGPAPEHEGIDMAVAIPGTLAGVLGIAIAWFMYSGDAARASAVVRGMGSIYRHIKNKFYFDEIYLFVTKGLVSGWLLLQSPGSIATSWTEA